MSETISNILEFSLINERNISYFSLSIAFFVLSMIMKSIHSTINQKSLNTIHQIKKQQITKNKKLIQNLDAKTISTSYLENLTRFANKGLQDEDLDFNYQKNTSLLVPENNSNLSFPKITVIYATQSNTAKSFAETIKKDSITTKLKVQVKNISDLEQSDFTSNLCLVFFIATYGEGEPTDDSLEFFKKIKDSNFISSNQDLSNLSYCVFGLGSSKYEKYNQMGKQLDEFLLSKKINQLMPLYCGDDAVNIRKDFDSWKVCFYKTIYSTLFNESNLKKKSDFIKKFNLNILAEDNKEYDIKFSDCSKIEVDGFSVDDKDFEYQIRSYLNSSDCKVEAIKEMRQQGKNGSTIKIEYSIDNSKGFKYEYGDNIGLYPANSEIDVLYVLKRLNLDPENYVHIVKYKQKLSKKLSIPSGKTIREILTYIVDLNGKVTKQMLKDIHKYVKDQDEYEKITDILQNDTNWEKFEQCQLTIVNVLDKFPSITIGFIDFYKILPRISTRFYTVASSSKYKKDCGLDIVISLIQFKQLNYPKKTEETIRYGLASNYYQKMNENFAFNKDNTTTKLIVRESGFKLPNNQNLPIIMICTGTGIAPFISFLQELEATNSKRETILIFGSKNHDCDFIYKEEISEFIRKGYLKHFYGVFSRDLVTLDNTKGEVSICSDSTSKKKYVQDYLEDINILLKNSLVGTSGQLFICGGVNMGSDVMRKLEELFGIHFIKQLENEKRLFKELWG